MTSIQEYTEVTGEDVVDRLCQLARPLRGIKVVHVNSTYVGGGVAEILNKLVPLQRDLGLDVRWEVIRGEERFFQITKSFHNALQGVPVPLGDACLKVYEETGAQNSEGLRSILEEADIVFIHDPQPLPLLRSCPNRKGKWIWRCHIDLSHPYRPLWKYLRQYVMEYDASIFSLAGFSQPLPHVQYLMPPSIDPLSEKNMSLSADKIHATKLQFGLDPERPMMLQVSRFDRFKDPLGVLRAYRLIKPFVPELQLVLAGGGATDDPEAETVLAEVRNEAGTDKDIHVLQLAPDAHVTINALQRGANVVLQKSLKEGFGLTVTEAMWKSKPVIGGDTGGIRLQVVNHHTGFLVKTPEGAALRVRFLLRNKGIAEVMGQKAQELVRQNFLLTRNLREYLSIMLARMFGDPERIELEGNAVRAITGLQTFETCNLKSSEF